MNLFPYYGWIDLNGKRSQVLESSIGMLVSEAHSCWFSTPNGLRVGSNAPIPFARLSASSLVSFLVSFSFRNLNTQAHLGAPSAWLSTFLFFSSSGCLLKTDVLANWAWSFLCSARREPASGIVSTEWWVYCVRCLLCYDLSLSMVLYHQQ